jgi:cytochrome c-type biogenesis protein CcmH/NrfG
VKARREYIDCSTFSTERSRDFFGNVSRFPARIDDRARRLHVGGPGRYYVISMSFKTVLRTVTLFLLLPLSSSCQTPATKDEQVTSHTQKMQQYLREGRPDLAIPELRALVVLDPGNADALGNLGVLLFFRGDYIAAIPQLRAALHLQPDLWKIQALLGLAEHKTSDDTAAMEDMANAFPHLQDEKTKLQVGRFLVSAYTASGHLDKAAAMVSLLLGSQPTDPSILYLAYRIYADQEDRTILTLALAAPTSAEMHVVMGRELARHGDEAPAIANYRAALQIAPQLPGVRLELGQILYGSSDENLQAQAEAEFRAALVANPSDEKAELMLGEIAAKRADLKSALDDDSRAVDLDPNDADACTELAKVLTSIRQSRNSWNLKNTKT